MMRRFLRPTARFDGPLRGAAIAALAMAALALPGRAEAGIRLTLTAAGAPAQVFVSSTDALAAITSIDGYTLTINSVLTNFLSDPNPNGGTLNTTTQYSTGSGPISDLSVLAEVIDGGAVGSPLAVFTGPNTPASIASVDVIGAGTSGQVTGTTFADGTSTSVGPLNIAGLVETANSTIVNTTAGYTLRNFLLIQGVSVNSGGQSVSVRSSVTAVPEPATVAMVLSALPLLGLGVLRRRRLAH